MRIPRWARRHPSQPRDIEEPPDKILISHDRLRLLVSEVLDQARRAQEWQAPLGVVVTLLATLAVSKFDKSVKTLGVQGDTWRLILTAATGAAAVWLLSTLRRARRPPTLDEVLARIIGRAENNQVDRALFVIKRMDGNNKFRLLTYYDSAWGCQMLPHENVRGLAFSERNDSRLRELLASHFSVPAAGLTIVHQSGCDLHSTKYSEIRKMETRYHFRFFQVLLPTPLPVDPTFTLDGTIFKWSSLEDLMTDQTTMDRNSDVVYHIRDYAAALLSTADNSQ